MRTASARWCSTNRCCHSAPSWTAQTSVAAAVPRRCSSPRARSRTVSASVRRLKYDSALVRMRTLPSAAVVCSTSPSASVFTSAHSPPTSGTIAPSRLSCCTAGPLVGIGSVAPRRAASASPRATRVRPTASVSRRAVSTLTGTSSSRSATRGTRSNGITVPSSTMLSTSHGSNVSGPNSSSSSRGENTPLAGGADPVLPLQHDRDIPLRRHLPPMAPPPDQLPATLPAPWTLLDRLLREPRHRTAGRRLGHHLRTHPVQLRVDRLRDLPKRRPRVRRSPRPHLPDYRLDLLGPPRLFSRPAHPAHRRAPPTSRVLDAISCGAPAPGT